MSAKGRPEILFPLFGDLQKLKGIGPKSVAAFEAAGLARPRDLLLTLPHSGIDRARKRSIRDVVPPAGSTAPASGRSGTSCHPPW